MNSFNSLDVQHFDVQNSKKERKKEKKKMQFTIIWNTCKIAKHFEKLTSET